MDYNNATNEQLEELLIRRDYEAIQELAHRCRTGSKGQEKNLTRAANLYHKGEKKGYAWAFQALGDMYATGEYFGQNMQIANEYYQKAGVSPVPEQTTAQQQVHTRFIKQSQTSSQTAGVDTALIKKLLEDGENSRLQDNTSMARTYAKQALEIINKGKAGMTVTGGGDLQVLEIEAYWLLAFVSFNEGKHDEMDTYLAQPDVYALHPWGTYLSAMVHRNNGLPTSMLENDMQRLIDVSQNPNMTPQERGDVLGLIAEFYLQGLHSGDGDTIELAYDYYCEAANNGNAYAAEQVGKFKTNLLGKIKYTG